MNIQILQIFIEPFEFKIIFIASNNIIKLINFN